MIFWNQNISRSVLNEYDVHITFQNLLVGII